MHFIFQIFGYIGSGLLSILFIPQVYITFKTKDVKGLSLGWIIFNLITGACWIVYSVGFFFDTNYLDGSIIMFANCSAIFFNIILTVLYMKYK